MRIAQVAPLYESVPPRGYGGTERVVSYLTEALQGLQRKDEAYESVREAIELDPEFFPARLQEGSLLLFDQRIAEAAVPLEQAVRLAPHSSRAHFQLSQAYQRLGKTDEAAAGCEKLRRLRHMRRCVVMGRPAA